MSNYKDINFPPYYFVNKSLQQFAEDFRENRIGCETIVKQFLDRINAHDSKLQSYVYYNEEYALDAAKQIDDLFKSGTDLGPLMGLPVAVKDLFSVENMPTRAGSKIDISDLLQPEGSFIKKLKEFGCVILGKTRTQEFAAGALNINHPTAWNPYNMSEHYTPGGSSQGSGVAMASGLCAFSIGTDTGGSVRLPAAMCSVFGYKPSRGLWDIDGVFPLCHRLDSIGFLTKSCQDAVFIFNTFSGKNLSDKMALNEITCGIDRDYFFKDMEPEVASAMNLTIAKLRQSGVIFRDIKLPSPDVVKDIFAHLVPYDLIKTLGKNRLQKNIKIADPILVNRLIPAMALTQEDYKKYNLVLNDYIVRSQKVMNQVDVLLAPTTPIIPWPVNQIMEIDKAISYTTRLTKNTRVTSAMDVCSCSLPVSHMNDASPKGPPVGLLLSCAHGQDSKLFSLALEITKTLEKP